MTELVLRAADDESTAFSPIRRATCPIATRLTRSSGQNDEMSCAELRRHRAVRPLADGADLSVDLARRRERVARRQRGLHVALEPLIAQVLFDAFLRVVEQRVGESKRAPAGVEVERPLHLRRQARRPLVRLFFGFVLRRVLRWQRGRSEQQDEHRQRDARDHGLWRRLTCNCARERTSEALTEATSSSEIFSRSRASARCRRFLGLGLVNVISLHCHVGHDRNAVGGDVDETLTNREVRVLSRLVRDDFARDHLRDQRHVQRVDPQLALDARERDHDDVLGEHRTVRRDYLQAQRVGHTFTVTRGRLLRCRPSCRSRFPAPRRACRRGSP